jgi:flavin-dependent dehydrogenase
MKSLENSAQPEGFLDRDTDVFIAGGGPAGLAAAIAARAKGLRVMVADAAQSPIDKACGEGLQPDSVTALRALGIGFDPDLSAPIVGVRFVSCTASVQASFPSGLGTGVRRTILHRLLATRAEEAGVTLLWGHRVTGLSGHSVKLQSETIRSQWIIGADGQGSRIRQWAGLDRKRRESFRFGFRRHYRMPPWSEFVEVHWGGDCQFYVTPIGRREVCVALISRDSHHRIDDVLDGFPELQRRLRDVEFTSQERGAISASRSLHRVTRGPVALIGDASGSVDAITGDGIYLALRQSAALAESLADGCLARYQTSHSQIRRGPVFIEQMLLLLDRSPWLRKRVLRTLENNSAIFERMVAMHSGEPSHAEFALDAILPLGWRLLQSR